MVSDSSIRQFTETQGWLYFQQPADEDARDPDPTTWPVIKLNIDEGSDGLAAVMFLAMELHINVDYSPDSANHGLHNDANLTDCDLGMKVNSAMFCQAANLAHSPYNTGQRLEESVDALTEFFNVHDHTCCLLQANLQDILDERGEGYRISEETIAMAVWDEVRHDPKLCERAAKMSGGRFMQPVAKAVNMCPVWTITKLRWIVYALATNQLDRARMEEYSNRVAAMTLARTADGQCPGLRAQSKRDDDSMARIGQNLLQKTIYLLEGEDVKVFINAKAVVMGTWLEWRGNHARGCQSVEGAREWLINELVGGFHEYITKSLDVFDNCASLERIGIETTLPRITEADHPHITQQNCHAAVTGKMCVRFVFHRWKRSLHQLVGWPGFGVLLSVEAVRDQVMAVLKSDWENYNGVKGHGGSFCQTVVRRSVFAWVSVQQLVAVCRRLGWTFWESDETREAQWLSVRFLTGLSTLFNENAFKYMRVKEPDNKVLSHLRKWTSLVKGPLVSEDFSYVGVDVSKAPQTARAQKLPPDLYKPLFRDAWPELRKVASIARNPGWESFMDVLAMRYIAKVHGGNWAILEELWKTALLNTEHILVRHRDSDVWHLPLGTVGTSGALALVASEFSIDHVDGGADSLLVYQPKVPVDHVTSIHIDNVGEWVAMVFQYRAPQWVFIDRGLASDDVEPMVLQDADKIGICMVPTHIQEPMQHACARRCFGRCQVPFLRRLCVMWDIDIRRSDGSLIAILIIMISAMLGVGEEELLDILMLRLEQFVPAMARLVDEPEITDVLEPDEVRELNQALEAEHKKRAGMDHYCRAYWRRRRAHTAASGSGGAAGHGPAGRRWVTPPPNCDLTQAEVRPLMPPRSAIWRNNVQGSWAIHVGPYYRSFKWSAHGPTVAAREAVQAAWKLQLMVFGEGLQSCPIADLFPAGAADLPSAPPRAAAAAAAG